MMKILVYTSKQHNEIQAKYKEIHTQIHYSQNVERQKGKSLRQEEEITCQVQRNSSKITAVFSSETARIKGREIIYSQW